MFSFFNNIKHSKNRLLILCLIFYIIHLFRTGTFLITKIIANEPIYTKRDNIGTDNIAGKDAVFIFSKESNILNKSCAK